MPPTTIKPHEVGRFSVDEENRLYWDGKIIQTESLVVLSGRQSRWAIAVAIAAIVGALATALNAGTNVWVAFFKPPVPTEQRREDPKASVAAPAQGPAAEKPVEQKSPDSPAKVSDKKLPSQSPGKKTPVRSSGVETPATPYPLQKR